MSHQPRSAAVQPHLSSGRLSNHPELAERIEKFQEATQALLGLYEPAEPRNETDSCTISDEGGETRCYYFSPAIIRHEKELLKRYHAEDFRGLLAETHVLLVGLVKIMKSTHSSVRVKGYVISSLGCLLEQASSLVLRMRNVYDRVERISR